MTFLCHHCGQHRLVTPNQPRIFHPVRGLIPACNLCARRHDEQD